MIYFRITTCFPLLHYCDKTGTIRRTKVTNNVISVHITISGEENKYYSNLSQPGAGLSAHFDSHKLVLFLLVLFFFLKEEGTTLPSH